MKLLESFKPHNLSKGGIDSITPSRISGWITNPNINFKEVRLLKGNQILTSSYINQLRMDVCTKFSTKGNHGFTILLPTEPYKKPYKSKEKFRIIAINEKYNKEFELHLFKNPQKTSIILERILRSEVLGKDGYIDGIQYDENLYGWAGLRNSPFSISIWMKGKDLKPIEIECKKWRSGLESHGIGEFSGFCINPKNEKYKSYRGLNVKFFFDKNCEFSVPQLNIIKIPDITKSENLSLIDPKFNIKSNNEEQTNEDINFYEEKINFSNVIQKKRWGNLKDYSNYIDNVEKEIKAYKALKINNKSGIMNLFNLLFCQKNFFLKSPLPK